MRMDLKSMALAGWRAISLRSIAWRAVAVAHQRAQPQAERSNLRTGKSNPMYLRNYRESQLFRIARS